MKNKIIGFLILIFLILVLVGGYIITKNKEIKSTTKLNNIKTKEEIKIPKEKTKEEIKKEIIINKINDYKKNIASKGLIITGDIHLKNEEYLFALQKFTNANKKTPNNPKIISKIAETYFLMKNFKSAYKYNKKLDNYEYQNKEQKTLSFLYSQNIDEYNFIKNSSGALTNSGNIFINNLKSEIKSFKLEKEEEFYYLNSLECLNSFHNCKLNFENYFKNDSYSGKNQNLENIRQAIDTYKNLKLEELYYKNALIIGSLLKNKNYPITIKLSKDLLEEKSNYKPILKILAQSYFELNKTDIANKYLIEYAKIDGKSPDVSYMIGVIEQKKHNYKRSNIFLNLAIEQNYPELEYIYRLQLYNYLILGEKEKITETFDKIIVIQEKPNFDDLLLATYYNIINENLEKAGLLANKGIKLYPESEDFYGFKAWILIEKGDLEQATELLNKAKNINPQNTLITLNLGRISEIKYKQSGSEFQKAKAKLLFKKVIELDSTEIGAKAKVFLEELEDK